MTDEEHIRFGLCLPKDKPFVDAVLDDFMQEETAKQKAISALKEEVKKLREENTKYKEAYFDQWYNNREIEKCWNVISGYNRQHLELHEAIGEYIRNREWNYEENLHCKPLIPVVRYYKIYSPLVKEVIGACTDYGLAHAKNEEPHCEFIEITKNEFDEINGFGEPVEAPNRNFPPHSTEQKIKGR